MPPALAPVRPARDGRAPDGVGSPPDPTAGATAARARAEEAAITARTRPNRRHLTGALGLAAALLVGACSSDSSTSSDTTASDGTTAGTTMGTARSGAPSLDEEALVAAFDEAAEELGVVGAFMLVRTPDGEVSSTYGITELDGTTRPTEDDHIRVGSNTKTWTGTAILQLVEEGKLELDDPVSRFRPEVPDGDNITIAQMLEMRSGLYNYTETEELNQTLDDDPTKAWTQDELLALAFANEPYFAPGEGYHYSNTNTVLLGLIAEQIEGKPLAEIFDERFFEPLGMTNTVFPDIADNLLPEPFAHGYMYGTNVETMTSPPDLPPELVSQIEAGTATPGDQTFANPSWGWSAGAGISSARDLATWVEAMLGGELLSPEMQQRRLDSVQPVDPTNPDSAGYGYGLARFATYYGHTGELPGYNSFMAHDPDSGVTIIVWANLAPLPQGGDPATAIARSLIGVLGM